MNPNPRGDYSKLDPYVAQVYEYADGWVAVLLEWFAPLRPTAIVSFPVSTDKVSAKYGPGLIASVCAPQLCHPLDGNYLVNAFYSLGAKSGEEFLYAAFWRCFKYLGTHITKLDMPDSLYSMFKYAESGAAHVPKELRPQVDYHRDYVLLVAAEKAETDKTLDSLAAVKHLIALPKESDYD